MKTIMDFINIFDNFLVFGHEDPDADSICSQIVISNFLKSLGKKTSLYSQIPFLRREIKPYEKYFSAKVSPEDIKGKTAVFLVDCALAERTGPFAEYAQKFPQVIIDHHLTPPVPEAAAFIDSSAPSATYLVYNFLKENNYKISTEESALLFMGLCTDTGFFRHLTSESGKAFKTAGELCDLGASPNDIFYTIYGNRESTSINFLKMMLERAVISHNGKLLVFHEKISDLEFYKETDRDKDMLYQIFLGIKGVKVAASFREEKNGKCSVGLRTRGDIDLSKVASHFGGGGHSKASGYTTQMCIEDAIADFTSYAPVFLA
ncbi:MAG: bifunctional oligoribonuclease/PAP phosphatase NrnA [Spirochaetia bacterium]|jgi:phosphoesterase RecJ-like protein|nr:bifunctional oligoribonuclease/PAP phosphatase NrnA [Spirochaetia bacterium]